MDVSWRSFYNDEECDAMLGSWDEEADPTSSENSASIILKLLMLLDVKSVLC